MWKKRLGIPLLVAIALMLTAGVTYADLKAKHWVDGWDEKSNRYAHSLNDVTFDGRWVSFLHELDFDNDEYPEVGAPAWHPAPCPLTPTLTTKWAGIMEYGLYHEDNSPDGAPGWQESREWKLVACDRDEDGDFDNLDLRVTPMTDVVPYTGGTLSVITKDQIIGCTTGNCKTEIVTTLFINTDDDCDGNQNTDVPPGGLCFYAEAQTPGVTVGSPLMWGGNIQARISAGGGDKTVNFNPQGGPTAVTLTSFMARSVGDDRSLPLTLWVTMAVPAVAAVGVVAWRMRRAQR